MRKLASTGNASGAPPPRNVVRLRPIHAHPAFRITVAGVIAVVLAGGFVVGRFLTANRPNRWLPERPGEAVVVEKLAGDRRQAEDFRLRVRVAVPPASPEESALLPHDHPGREDALGPRELLYDLPTPEQDWSAVEPGDHLRASYQINVARSKIIVRALYLDHLQE